MKSKFRKLSHSKNKVIKSVYFILRFNWLLLKFFINKKHRAYVWCNLFPKNGQYQISTKTYTNRYPIIFRTCADYLLSKNKPSLKILSFGCSTGEEVLSLESYLPKAKIIGVDINKKCIDTCHKLKSNHSFYLSNSLEFENEKDFDAVFCMAVFQRTQNRTRKVNSIAIGITFEQFEHEISKLDSKLNSGGLLIIENTDFDFNDTKSALNYKPLDFEKNKKIHDRPLYNSKNEKISERQFLNRVFVKMD